jgi:hypothetical protein
VEQGVPPGCGGRSRCWRHMEAVGQAPLATLDSLGLGGDNGGAMVRGDCDI